jgi:Nuclear transport factor 2 (NTF2) domain
MVSAMTSELLPTEHESNAISGINELTVSQYFTTLNDGRFAQTAALFSESGTLKPPFDKLIQGREGITAYLAKEARGMKFCPEQGELIADSEGQTQISVRGKVDTSFFAINVNWLFHLNEAKKLASVEVKLLAALNELLQINRGPST